MISKLLNYKLITMNIAFLSSFILMEKAEAQTGQIKATAGQSLNVTPDVATTHPNSDGFGIYALGGGSIVSDMGNVVTNGSSASGLFATDTGSIIHWQGTTIETHGFRGRGIDALHGAQVIGYGTIITNGDKAHGIQAAVTTAVSGPAQITLLPSTSVHTFGNDAYGLHAYSSSTITGTVNVITEGTGSFGVHSEKDSTITLTTSNIETHGAGAFGLLANTDDITVGVDYTPGKLVVSSSTVTTTGDNAFGAFADVQASMELTDITINTTGENAAGLFAHLGGSITSQGSITTTGNNAHGAAAGMSPTPGFTDTIEHSGSIVTQGDNAYGIYGMNGAEFKISGSIHTHGDASQGAYLDGASLDMPALTVDTSGDNAAGIHAVNGATISGQADITTQGANSHGMIVEAGSNITLNNSHIVTHDDLADGALVTSSNITLSNTTIVTQGHGLTVTDSSIVTLTDSDITSKLSAIDVSFSAVDQHAEVNIGGTSHLNSETGVILNVTRDNAAAETGIVALNIQDGSVVTGNITDNGTKTTGYTDVLLGADVIWTGHASGIRHFKSLNSNSIVNFAAGSDIGGDLHGVRSKFVFHPSGINVAGNVLLTDNSHAGGGSLNGVIDVAGDVNVDDTSTQAGNWSVAGDLTNHGTMAPIGAAGMINVGGDYILSGTSVYMLDINQLSMNAVINVAGSASLAGKVSLVTPLTSVALNYRYTILTAAGGLNGTMYNGGLSWDNTPAYLYVAPQLTYDANNAYLTLTRNNVAIASAGRTANERAVGRALDSNAQSTGTVHNTLLLHTNEAAVRAQLANLSGEAHQSVLAELQQGSHRVRDAIAGRLYEMVETAPAVWGRFITRQGDADATDYSSLSSQTDSFFWGADTSFNESLRAGLMAGIEKSTFNVDDLNSSSRVDSYHVGVYGRWKEQAVSVHLGGAYSWHNVIMDRSFVAGANPQTLKSDYQAQTVQLFGELAYDLNVDMFDFQPFAGLAYVRTQRDGFAEQTINPLIDGALQTDDTALSNTFTSLGVRFGKQWQHANDVKVKIHMAPAWRHAFGDEQANSIFVLNPTTSFNIGGLPLSRDVFAMETGLSVDFNPRVSVGVSYDGQFGSKNQQNAFKGKMSVKF
ncbi:hypothetical protein MP213Fo_05000 [Pseudochrobactrum sp. MP213Fo]